MSELRQALAAKPSDTEFVLMAQTELFIIKTVTAGLITDPERDVKIFHRTAQEYFDDN